MIPEPLTLGPAGAKLIRRIDGPARSSRLPRTLSEVSEANARVATGSSAGVALEDSVSPGAGR